MKRLPIFLSLLSFLALSLTATCGLHAQVVASATYPAHVVQKGETLFGIAQRYDMQVAELQALNGLRSDLIYPGQRLLLSRQPVATGANARMRSTGPEVVPSSAPAKLIVTRDARGGQALQAALTTKRSFQPAGARQPQDVNVNITLDGVASEMNAAALRAAAVAGIMKATNPEVNMVSAPLMAQERGIDVSLTTQGQTGIFEGYIKLTVKMPGRERSIAGTVFSDGKPRFIQIKGVNIDAEIGAHMLYTTNRDVPGIIGTLGQTMGENGVNIANFTLGRTEKGHNAIALLYVDEVTTPGRMIVTSLDPCYHHGSHFMPATTRFLAAFLPALRAVVREGERRRISPHGAGAGGRG